MGDGLLNSEQSEVARASYNKMSKVYGFLSNSSEKKFVEVAIRQVLKPQVGERILEPGFGSGQVLAALADMVGTSGKVYGIDISDGMVKVTRKRLARRGLIDRAELVRGDALNMPYANGFFDAVFMSFTLELFPDRQIPLLLEECARVLKDGGRLCVASMSNQGKSGTMMRLYLWSHRKHPHFVDCRPIFAMGIIKSSGFEILEERILSMWGLPVEIVLGRKRQAESAGQD
jgi:ubiquinone/menaquinone biosynthesis C-methylase UbiE